MLQPIWPPSAEEKSFITLTAGYQKKDPVQKKGRYFLCFSIKNFSLFGRKKLCNDWGFIPFHKICLN
jgi:hypothetical protein